MRQTDYMPWIMGMGFLILILGLAGGIYIISIGVEHALSEDTQTTIIDISDVTDLPDEYNTTEPDPEPDPPDDGNDDTTIVEDPTDPDDDQDPVTPPTYDHRFSGTITVKAELIGVSGNPLAFVKELYGEPIDKLKIRYEWNFELGEDLDPSTFTLMTVGTIKKIYYQDLIDTYNKGSFFGGKIFTTYAFDAEGWDTQTFDIDSSKLGFIQARGIGSGRLLLTTSTSSFPIEWEAIVSTKGGTVKKIQGQNGIAIRIIWDYSQSDYYRPDPTDPSSPYYPYDPYYDPYHQEPLMSIVVR
jgi:hypothetical protein